MSSLVYNPPYVLIHPTTHDTLENSGLPTVMFPLERLMHTIRQIEGTRFSYSLLLTVNLQQQPLQM